MRINKTRIPSIKEIKSVIPLEWFPVYFAIGASLVMLISILLRLLMQFITAFMNTDWSKVIPTDPYTIITLGVSIIIVMVIAVLMIKKTINDAKEELLERLANEKNV